LETTERKVTPDCIPEILRRVVEVAARASDDAWFQTRVLKQAMSAIVDADFDRSATELTFDALAVAGKLVGKGDVYEEAKTSANQTMLSLLPELRQMAGEAANRQKPPPAKLRPPPPPRPPPPKRLQRSRRPAYRRHPTGRGGQRAGVSRGR
jgi:hypothetical protein